MEAINFKVITFWIQTVFGFAGPKVFLCQQLIAHPMASLCLRRLSWFCFFALINQFLCAVWPHWSTLDAINLFVWRVWAAFHYRLAANYSIVCHLIFCVRVFKWNTNDYLPIFPYNERKRSSIVYMEEIIKVGEHCLCVQSLKWSSFSLAFGFSESFNWVSF